MGVIRGNKWSTSSVVFVPSANMAFQRGFCGKVFRAFFTIKSISKMDLSEVGPDNPKLREDLVVTHLAFWYISDTSANIFFAVLAHNG